MTKRLPPNSFQSNDERMTEETTVRKLLHIERSTVMEYTLWHATVSGTSLRGILWKNKSIV